MPPAVKPTQQQIQALAQRAEQLLSRGEPHLAIQTLAPVFPFLQKLPRVLQIYARATDRIGQHERSAEIFKTICKQLPSDPDLRLEYAIALAHVGRFEAALEQVRRVREQRPAHAQSVIAEAEFLMDLSRPGEALETLDRYEREQAPADLELRDRAHLCSTRSRLAPKHIPPEAVVRDLVGYADNPEVKGKIRGVIASRAARLLDLMGEYDEAMRMTALSKEIRGVPWDPGAYSAKTDAMIRAWTSPEAAALPRAKVDGSGVVFILGMPRSGSSLLEQMLGRHPAFQPMGECNDIVLAAGDIHTPPPREMPMVYALGRMTPAFVQEVAERTLARMLPRRDKGRSVLIDKQPINFLYVPLIARLLPGAKVLHTVRDGRDTCLLYFMQWFNGPHGQSNSMETLGRYYADYRRTMDAWRALPAPEQRPEMLDVVYEELVADPERVMREVLGFLGFEFDPVVLDASASDRIVATASRDQVKSSIYTSSVAKWKHYEKHFAPFFRHAGAYFASEDRGA